ncbi:MAG: TolC family protein [Opitutales bacterium]|nr:TolC family protein [Opitutales bacterium]
MRMPVLLVCVCLATGCASLQPIEETALSEGIPERWTSETVLNELPIAADFLELVDAESLRELVHEALENNPDLGATAKRLAAQEYLLGLTRAPMRPRVQGGLNSDRNDLDTGAYNNHRATIGVSWELDLWGRLADEHAAGRGAYLAAERDWQRARDALAARVIQTWIEQVTFRRAVTIENERVEVLRKVELLLTERYRDGTGNLDELSSARSRREIAKADLALQQAALNESVRRLELLVGRFPEGKLVSSEGLPIVRTAVANVPVETLKNRPDVQAAFARVESAQRAARSAKKEALPSLRFSGDIFREGAQLSSLGGVANQWSLLGSLFQPLFEGGRIQSVSRARISEVEAVLLDLRSVVLQAFKEVEDVMDVEKSLRAQAEALTVAAEDSELSSRYYEDRYRKGLDSLQSMLIAKEQEMAVKLRLNDVRGRTLINRVNLALTLGTSVKTGDIL